MKTRWFTTSIVAAVALALGIAPAFADDTKAKSSGAGSDQHKAAGGKSDGAASPKMDSAAGDFTGRHTMDGEVTKIDQTKGTLSLKTAEGTMDLHFPPSALSNVKKGDRIAVELALKPSSGGGAASPSTSGSRAGSSGAGSSGAGSSGPDGAKSGSKY